MNQSLTTAVNAWHALGCTPIPITPDGTKRPCIAWKPWQQSQADISTVQAWFAHADTDGFAIPTGTPQNRLIMIELEGRAVREGLPARLGQTFADHNLSGLWDLLGTYTELTPSAGIHWYVRLADDGQPVPGNTKLARRPSTPKELEAAPGAKVQVLAETRGAGGYTIVAPSGGRTHTTGAAWAAVSGTPEQIPTITRDQYDTIIGLIGMCDQMPGPEPITAPHTATLGHLLPSDNGIRPGDDYNARTHWIDILGPHGWTITHRASDGTISWVRPGKKANDGVSATTGRGGTDNLYVFSTSTEFETERPYSKFAAYTLLNHCGDWSAAVSELKKNGYGTPTPLASQPTSIIDLHPSQQLVETVAVQAEGATLTVVEPDPTPQQIAAAYGPTEDGIARALIHLYKHELRYCPERSKWLVWTGSRWAWDLTEQHREHIRSIGRSLPEHDTWRSFKKRALSAAGVTGIARLAQTDIDVAVNIDDLDANPYDLNTPGGIIDLRTGVMRPPDPAALCTRTTGATPDLTMPAPVFTRFLSDTFGEDADLITYMQRLLGVSAIGAVSEQILPFATGTGANGKSTLFEACMDALGRGEGGYAIAAASEMLMIRRHEEHPAEIAQLAGARLVVCQEIEDGARFAEARVKMLTGRDSINARFMRGDPFTFKPTHTLWVVGNNKPDVSAGGPAFWRRMRAIEFAHVVPDDRKDPLLGSKIELPAVLAWIAQGAADYAKYGLSTPASVQTSTQAYAQEQDTVGRFLDDCCHVSPGNDALETSTQALRAAYEAWCRESGANALHQRRFSHELEAHGFKSKRTNRTRGWLGVALNTQASLDISESVYQSWGP